ncbi:MAG TPA: hypothetical protein VFS50_16500 [Meiothermus sp.]|nr:hypothetical protein [Meiothermus sp.]
MHRFLALLVVLALGAVLAQPGPGGPPNLTPEMQKKFQEYRPVFDLTSSIRMLAEVDAQKGLAFSKAQAQKLLPILKDLQSRSDLKPADANKILSNIEDSILTPAQLKWMDETQLKRQQEARQRAQQGQQGQGGGGFFGPGGPGGQNGGNRQGSPRGGLFQAILQGKPFNPFKEGRAAENLQQLITLLSKR